MKHNPEGHFRLVHKIANRYKKGNRMEYDDIYQEGCIGLMRACREYKSGEVPFGAFAAMHIKFAILTALRGSHLLYVDSNTVTLAMKIHKDNLKEMPAKEIAEKLKKPVNLIERALDYLKLDVLSLDYEYSNRKDDKELTILDNHGYMPNYEDKIYIEQMLDLFEVSEREKPIIRMVMDGHALKDAAISLGMSHRAEQQRKYRRKNLLADKKELVYA